MPQRADNATYVHDMSDDAFDLWLEVKAAPEKEHSVDHLSPRDRLALLDALGIQRTRYNTQVWART